ncbi:hypothetical protein [Marinobacter panjinensis]|uniref:hypothetical protein n=1 Tax=Marinobacter panjinensis TaxID=2576384 RepID=UPI0014850057|nr:hypothetical protein [Marinobacter panjinensis]MCR8915653.1 hypothetical protein [Marinobacter panjinensis]
MENRKIRWGIIGTAEIATKVVAGVHDAKNVGAFRIRRIERRGCVSLRHSQWIESGSGYCDDKTGPDNRHQRRHWP